MTTPFENILFTSAGRRARIVLNRPDKLNPLDKVTVRELRAAVAAIEANDEILSVVITGAGRAFSAGGDLNGYLSLYRQEADLKQFLDDFLALGESMEASRKIYIAAVNGVCVAGGLELMLACDLAIADPSARIGDGHMNFAQIPGAGSSQRLPRAIGPLRAKKLLLTGELLRAQEAERIGLINEVAGEGQLEVAVEALIENLEAKSPSCLGGMKYLANQALDRDLADGLRLEIDYMYNNALSNPDTMEGLIAFRDKRKPNYA